MSTTEHVILFWWSQTQWKSAYGLHCMSHVPLLTLERWHDASFMQPTCTNAQVRHVHTQRKHPHVDTHSHTLTHTQSSFRVCTGPWFVFCFHLYFWDLIIKTQHIRICIYYILIPQILQLELRSIVELHIQRGQKLLDSWFFAELFHELLTTAIFPYPQSCRGYYNSKILSGFFFPTTAVLGFWVWTRFAFVCAIGGEVW